MPTLETTPLEPQQLVEEYSDMVLRAALSLVKHLQDAEDIAQEVFLTLMRKPPVFESREHQKAWLLRCTINRCKSLFRSSWHRTTAPLEEHLTVPFTPEENQVLDAVRQLPMKYRQVIYLHYIEGYSTAEIASLLHRPQNTVLSQLSRGRSLLKDALKGEF
ncbi:MAG: sigma-70 family RNA polymerase sigma factor [Candidatus Fournierella pullistercoris]|uniref:Sigma-70 family RNA polymerase sigma factor n=1 Tax=Candidatus Allofournierella pullistercoris TaxID=2838597 RepID=A0A948T3D0_9FIRM|nr:sigma-70 family RNA polymerase sigma factor [Candidatus Fournierella pullistercoris]